jgi:hypothetical protein
LVPAHSPQMDAQIFLPSYFVYSQICLNCAMDDHHCS